MPGWVQVVQLCLLSLLSPTLPALHAHEKFLSLSAPSSLFFPAKPLLCDEVHVMSPAAQNGHVAACAHTQQYVRPSNHRWIMVPGTTASDLAWDADSRRVCHPPGNSW